MARNRLGRARIVFAGLASAVLIGAVIVAMTARPDEAEDVPAECLTAWNEDSLALSDGAHAYAEHGYRETQLTRIDSRCAVVFAAPNVDFEPAFGVRVLERDRWVALATADELPVDRIEAMQRDATAQSNATLLPDGRLAGD
ncbi:MAG: hypothetical protein M3383_03310 [Actinomycetota bacterium]|nr:hypothetical protein [Actinomycetota bacterium]